MAKEKDECHVCFEPYDAVARPRTRFAPLHAQCKHCVCMPCKADMVRRGAKLCPFCRAKDEGENGPASLDAISLFHCVAHTIMVFSLLVLHLHANSMLAEKIEAGIGPDQVGNTMISTLVETTVEEQSVAMERFIRDLNEIVEQARRVKERSWVPRWPQQDDTGPQGPRGVPGTTGPTGRQE